MNEIPPNPFRPGAGHKPPYLAGRINEKKDFQDLLKQDIILKNLVLTGLRGIGKTVLVDEFKEIAINSNWLWTGTEMSESASVDESTITLRILTDLSVISSNFLLDIQEIKKIGFFQEKKVKKNYLTYDILMNYYNSIPGLIIDKLKEIMKLVWGKIKQNGNWKGLIFAYDEAQTLSDKKGKEHYPLQLILDLFQSIQKQNIPFMLIFTGLPMLPQKLVESRTYSERMFNIMFLDKLSLDESEKAVRKPITDTNYPTKFSDDYIKTILEHSGGYPYFIQFICREVYDIVHQQSKIKNPPFVIPIESIIQKLDRDFFSGRWLKATVRQRELLHIIANLTKNDLEFTVQEIVEESKNLSQEPFKNSSVNQMLNSLIDSGLVFKNRYGKYSLSIPLFDKFILRFFKENETFLNL